MPKTRMPFVSQILEQIADGRTVSGDQPRLHLIPSHLMVADADDTGEDVNEHEEARKRRVALWGEGDRWRASFFTLAMPFFTSLSHSFSVIHSAHYHCVRGASVLPQRLFTIWIGSDPLRPDEVS